MEVKRSERLLIVEDDAAIRRTLSEFLCLEGYEVFTAENGQEALERLPFFRPDLVISDILMPVCDGLQLARSLSQLPNPVSVLLMSGYGGQGDLEALRDNPCFVGFVPKPIQIDAMLTDIAEFFRERKVAVCGR